MHFTTLEPESYNPHVPPRDRARRRPRMLRPLRPWIAALSAVSITSACGPPKETQEYQPPRERSRIAVVRERPGSARLEGLGPIRGFAIGRDSTFMHCLELVLDALGRKIEYDELMGISGMAFRIQFCADRWDPGNPDPLVGRNCVDDLCRDIGISYELFVVRREDLLAADALRRRVIEQLDRGLPVIAANVMPPEDWGFLTGYQRDGGIWLCRAYHGDAERVDRVARAWPTAVVFINKERPRPDPVVAHRASIRRAVDLFAARSTGAYALGAAAFDQWMQRLAGPVDRTYIHPNAWTFVGLLDARSSAVRYLRAIAQDFGPRQATILRAAELYEQEVRLLHAAIADVPGEAQFPDSLPPVELRNRQISVLSRAKALEQQAVAVLGEAL